MSYSVLPAFLALSFASPAFAATPGCSTQAAQDTPDSQLSGLARISNADAQKIALGSVKVKGKKTLEGELEVENGCLVYSYDVRVAGKSGLEEIMVDAGTGKILSHTHENTRQEAAEQARDAMTHKH